MLDRSGGFVHRMWSNVMDVDRLDLPKRAESGRLWTPTCVDLFRLFDEGMKVVKETSTDFMLLHVAIVINQVWPPKTLMNVFPFHK